MANFTVILLVLVALCSAEEREFASLVAIIYTLAVMLLLVGKIDGDQSKR